MREKWKRAYYAESLRQSYYGPHSGLSQDAGASHILVGGAEMFLFGNVSSAKPQPEKKGEKRQHPEHFKFISYIFTLLNQAQKQKKESHVSTSFPPASPNTAGCLSSSPYHHNNPASMAECCSQAGHWANALSYWVPVKIPHGRYHFSFWFLQWGNWCLEMLSYLITFQS